MNFVVGIIVTIGLLVAGILFLIAMDPGLLEAEHAGVSGTVSSVTDAGISANSGAVLVDMFSYFL